MFTLDEVAALLVAVASNAVSLASGLLGIVLTIVSIWVPDHLKRAARILGIIAIVLSPMFAWLDEHRMHIAIVRKIDEKAPKLVGTVQQITGYEMADGIVLAVLFRIVNIGSVPTTPHGFRLTFNWSRPYPPEPIVPFTFPEETLEIKGPDGKISSYKAKDGLLARVVDPISPGAVRTGWLFYRIKGLRYVDVYGQTIKISLLDHLLNRYYAIGPKMLNRGGNDLTWPGIDIPSGGR